MCFLRSLWVVKCLPQFSTSQLKVLPVWSLVWALSLYNVVKALSHPGTWQTNGFSLVCIRIWTWNLNIAFKNSFFRPLEPVANVSFSDNRLSKRFLISKITQPLNYSWRERPCCILQRCIWTCSPPCGSSGGSSSSLGLCMICCSLGNHSETFSMLWSWLRHLKLELAWCLCLNQAAEMRAMAKAMMPQTKK